MTNPSEKKKIDNPGFIAYVENRQYSGELTEMLSTRVVPSFLSSMQRHRISDFSQDAIRCWTLDMLISPVKLSTIQRYLGSLHTLFSEWVKTFHTTQSEDGSVPISNNLTDSELQLDFRIDSSLISNDSSFNYFKRTDYNLKRIDNIARLKCTLFSREYTLKHAFLYLLANPGVGLSEIVDMKFSDQLKDSFNTDIVTSMRNMPQAKYVFPLEQGKHRRQHLLRSLLSGLHSIAGSAGLDFGSSFSRESITALWITAALREGIPASQIISLAEGNFNIPSQLSLLNAITPAPITDERKIEIYSEIAALFIKDSNAWFAMRLRPGVTPATIQEELSRKKFPVYRHMEFFYPTRKMKKKKGKKIVMADVPLVPSILFFRMRGDDIPGMMSLIGNLAWVYRSSSAKDSPYSSIPANEMNIFMRSVKTLDSDSGIDISSSLPPLSVGDEVVIENGTILDGQHAVVRKIRRKDGTLIYSLRLSSSEYIQWREISLPATNVSKS